MNSKTLTKALSCATLLASAMSSTAAHAQSSETAAGQGADDTSEIIVTARGRNEALLTSPVAITAFSSQALDDARIKNVGDFIGLTPNISIVQSQSAGISFVTVRGISQVRNGESPIAVVTDGVQQVTSRQFTSDLFDVQQIEVLRGPQGALYGRNAIGGAIIVTTKQPTNDLRVNAQASAGNGDDYRAEASISGPIVADKLLFRLSGSARNFGGLLHNAYLDQTVDMVRDRNVRGQLKAVLSDALTADLRAGYSHTRGIGNPFVFQSANLIPGTCFLDPANPFGGPAPDANRVSRELCPNNRGTNTRSVADASLKLEHKADWGTITNVLSAVQVKEFIAVDQFPFTASRNIFGTDGTQTQYENLKAWQNDFRVASSESGKLRWMVGAYYLRTTRFLSTTTGRDNGLGILPIHRLPAYGDATNPTLSFLADNNHNTAYAFYGNIAYDITPKLEASFAYRYDHDRRHQSISPLSSAGLPIGCTTAATGPCDRTANFHKGQPKFTLNYKASPDLTIFADYGIGFRSGQFNQSGAAAAANLPGVFDLVRQETAATAEIGFKARLLDGKLRFSGTAFHTRDRDPFYFLFVGAVGAQILVNIDKVELYGGELEATFTPVTGLDVFANYGYTHSRIKSFEFNPAVVGNQAPYIPRDGGALGAQYRFALTNSLKLFTRADVEHHGRQFWDPENSTARSSFQIFNLRAGVEAADGRWALTGYVRNLTDKKYNVEFVSGGFAQPAEPRMYGIEMRANF